MRIGSRLKKCLLILQLTALLSLGLFGWANIEIYLRSRINSELIVDKEGALYHLWAEPPIHPMMKVYVFNVTNKEEWLASNGDVKLKVEEVGPLVYRETWWKTNVQILDSGDVSYDLVKRFDPLVEEFGCDPYATVIIPNIPLFSGAARIKDESEALGWAFENAIEMIESTLFVEVKVQDILWGYEEPLLAGASMVLPEEEIKVPGHFGLLAGRNMSSEGRYTVRGGFGSEGISRLGAVTRWEDMSSYSCWETEECNRVSGGEGSQFPPGLDRGNPLSIFIPQMCRDLPLVYVQDDYLNGILTYRYEPDSQVFNYSAQTSSCYCIPPANCSGNGLFYVAPCKFGAPLVVSWPHFLDATDQSDTLEGVHPSPYLHRFQMNIQPDMGMGLSAKIRLQLNLDLMKPKDIPLFSRVPVERMLVPIMWFEDTISDPPENLMIVLRDALALPRHVKNGFLLICLCSIVIQLYALALRRIATTPNLEDVMFGVSLLGKFTRGRETSV